jgi:DNA-binding PadR family transcriptional regulator
MLTESRWYTLQALLEGDYNDLELLKAVNSQAMEYVDPSNYFNQVLKKMAEEGLIEGKEDSEAPKARKNSRPRIRYRMTQEGIVETLRLQATLMRMLRIGQMVKEQMLEEKNELDREVELGMRGW